ncbi:MAG: homoaconitate hydratase [Candidatus Freyarchaeota archaeon]|nr:homoaconitate hydratase [Candidatus Jordarchaeia archaeon]
MMAFENEEGLIENYNRVPGIFPSNLPERVYIWDETLRDGEQTPGVFLTVEEKIEIAKLLDEVGVGVIVPGYPAVSKTEREAVKRIANENLNIALVAAPARPKKEDIDLCLECDVDEIPIFMPTSRLMMKYSLNKTLQEAKKMLSDAISYALDHGVKVDFVAEDASRAKIEDLIYLSKEVVESGVNKIIVADTVGILHPLSMKYLISNLREALKGQLVEFAVHCHNDLGLATANTLAAVEEGVIYPHTCVNGYGERSGNAAFEEVVVALEVLYGIKTGIKMEKIYEVSQFVEQCFNIPIPLHKPLVGGNAFIHESGIHVRALLQHKLTYQPIPPEIIGRKTEFLLGKFTGSSIVHHILKSKGIEVTDEQLKKIVERIKQLQESRGKVVAREAFSKIKQLLREIRRNVSEKELLEIVNEVLQEKCYKTE